MRSLAHISGRFFTFGSTLVALTHLAGCAPVPEGPSFDSGKLGSGGGSDGSVHPGSGGASGGSAGASTDALGGLGGAGLSTGDGGTQGGGDGSGGSGATASVPCSSGTFDHDGDADTGCVPWSVCAPGETLAGEGSGTSDVECEACPEGAFSTEENADECDSWQVCVAGEFQHAEGTATEDSVCEPCAVGTFSLGGASSCTAHRVCGWAEVEIGPGTATSDTECAAANAYRQFGTSSDDVALDAMKGPSGGVYVVGSTSGSLAEGGAGGADSFLRLYDGAGNAIWTRQFGFAGDDAASDVAVDQSGDVLVLEQAEGQSGEGPVASLRKFDASGTELWRVEITGDDPCLGRSLVVSAAGEAFVAGVTPAADAASADVCVRKVSPAGELSWSRHVGSTLGEGVGGIALTSDGRLLVAGWTDGVLGAASAGARDAFVWSLGTDGTEHWLRQLGSPQDDAAVAVAGLAGALGLPGSHVVGWTKGDLISPSAGEEDIFIRALGTDGQELEGIQYGTAASELPTALLDGGPRLFIAARTEEVGSESGADGLLLVYRKALGDTLAVPFGTPADDVPTGIAKAASGGVFVVGSTTGALAGENLGMRDAFVGFFAVPNQW